MKKILLIILLSVILFATNFEENKKACDSGVMDGCHKLGLMYFKGDGVTQDYAKAKELFNKAC